MTTLVRLGLRAKGKRNETKCARAQAPYSPEPHTLEPKNIQRGHRDLENAPAVRNYTKEEVSPRGYESVCVYICVLWSRFRIRLISSVLLSDLHKHLCRHIPPIEVLLLGPQAETRSYIHDQILQHKERDLHFIIT